jgi:hypothetical protein
MLAAAGLLHIGLLRDLQGGWAWTLALLVGLIGFFLNLAIGLAIGLALWWVPAGHRPAATEGIARLEKLARLGPTPEAFTFKSPFPPPVSHG